QPYQCLPPARSAAPGSAASTSTTAPTDSKRLRSDWAAIGSSAVVLVDRPDDCGRAQYPPRPAYECERDEEPGQHQPPDPAPVLTPRDPKRRTSQKDGDDEPEVGPGELVDAGHGPPWAGSVPPKYDRPSLRRQMPAWREA